MKRHQPSAHPPQTRYCRKTTHPKLASMEVRKSPEEILRMLESDDEETRLRAAEEFHYIIGPPTPSQAETLAIVALESTTIGSYAVALWVAGDVLGLLRREDSEAHRSGMKILDLFLEFVGDDRNLVEVGFWEPFEQWVSKSPLDNALLAEVKNKLDVK